MNANFITCSAKIVNPVTISDFHYHVMFGTSTYSTIDSTVSRQLVFVNKTQSSTYCD